MSDIDDGNVIDWGKTSRDYTRWRPNYPDRFFQLLTSFGIGLPGQRILDLGTGVGFLALRFAQAGAAVTGVDIAAGQIHEARRRSEALHVNAQFLVAPAENTGLPSHSFDVVTASQSWLYFDTNRVIEEVKRLLTRDGLLLTSHLIWLPRQDPIAQASERLVLQHNPGWSHADLSGEFPIVPSWAAGHFRLHAMFAFDESLPFTRESWRGRIRACRAIGATLTPGQMENFDREHEALLHSIAPERFAVLHRIDAHILRPI
jgi:SAM-dependent methyltransferase